jgi:hypothetical protein
LRLGITREGQRVLRPSLCSVEYIMQSTQSQQDTREADGFCLQHIAACEFVSPQ